MALRPEEEGTQTLFVNTSNIPKEKWRPPLMEENWVVLCQAPYPFVKLLEWIEMLEKLKDISKTTGLKKSWRRGELAGLCKVARQEICCVKLSCQFGVAIRQALRMCDGRQKEEDVSDASYVSWDRVDDP